MAKKQYFLVNSKGEIIDTKFFEEGETVPKDCKKAWTDSMQKPYWDFISNSWKDKYNEEDRLLDYKYEKRKHLNNECQKKIIAGFKIVINDTEYHFSYDEKDQLNLQETHMLFENEIISEIVYSCRLNDEPHRIKLNKQDFLNVYMESVKHKHDTISKLKDSLYPIIENASSVEMIEKITWDTIVVSPELPPIAVNPNDSLSKKIDIIKEVQKKTEITGDLLSKQIGVSSDYVDFLEEVIIEIAQMVYA